MSEIETHRESFVGANKIDFLNHAIGEAPAGSGQISILADANVFRPKDELNRLSFTKPSRFLFRRQLCGADFHCALRGYTQQQTRTTEKRRHVFSFGVI